ncbi:MAG: hypothetical protein WB586_07425 [Chthoniobacterales bacterium]
MSPGTYLTDGNIDIENNVQFVGSGPGNTTIERRAGSGRYVFIGYAVNNWEVWNLTVQVNATNEYAVACNMMGNNILFKNCNVSGWGSDGSNGECFPMLFNIDGNSYPKGTHFSGVHVENCVFNSYGSLGGDGLSILSMDSDHQNGCYLTDAAIWGCTFYFNNPNGAYYNAIGAYDCENNTIYGSGLVPQNQVGWGLEPGSNNGLLNSPQVCHQGNLIQNNNFVHVATALSMNCLPNGVTGPIEIVGNRFWFTNSPDYYQAAFQIFVNTSPAPSLFCGEIYFVGNYIYGNKQSPNYLALDASDTSLPIQGIGGIVISGNISDTPGVENVVHAGCTTLPWVPGPNTNIQTIVTP